MFVVGSDFNVELRNKAEIQRDDKRVIELGISHRAAITAHFCASSVQNCAFVVIGRAGQSRFCKERPAPWESFSDRLHCFIAALILKPSVLRPSPYVTQKKCRGAADIMIISNAMQWGDKNSSTRRRGGWHG